MAETKDQLIEHGRVESGRLLFKYVLRLMGVEEARRLETHLADCNACAAELAGVTRFFELLERALRLAPRGARGELQTGSSRREGQEEQPALQDLVKPPGHIEEERLIDVFVRCYAGFERLRKNIAARMPGTNDMEQIEQAAIEILIALPGQVSKL